MIILKYKNRKLYCRELGYLTNDAVLSLLLKDVFCKVVCHQTKLNITTDFLKSLPLEVYLKQKVKLDRFLAEKGIYE